MGRWVAETGPLVTLCRGPALGSPRPLLNKGTDQIRAEIHGNGRTLSYRAGLWRPRRMSISRRAPSEKLRGRLCQEETHWPNSSAAWNMTELMSVLQRSDRLVVRELSRLGRSLGVRRGRARPDLRSAPPEGLARG